MAGRSISNLWVTTLVVSSCAMAGTGTTLYFFAEKQKAHLANMQLLRVAKTNCYPARIGEAVALVYDQGQLQCKVYYDGIPQDIWYEVLHRRVRRPAL